MAPDLAEARGYVGRAVSKWFAANAIARTPAAFYAGKVAGVVTSVLSLDGKSVVKGVFYPIK